VDLLEAAMVAVHVASMLANEVSELCVKLQELLDMVCNVAAIGWPVAIFFPLTRIRNMYFGRVAEKPPGSDLKAISILFLFFPSTFKFFVKIGVTLHFVSLAAFTLTVNYEYWYTSTSAAFIIDIFCFAMLIN